MRLVTLFLAAQLAAASSFWYENIVHNGISPTIPNGHNWTVFRNVKEFGAKGDGVTDDTAAIQAAISTGDSTGLRDSPQFGTTGQPAMVYFPSGTYLIKSTIRSAIGTVLMGDPTDRPIIKAASNFTGAYLVVGRGNRYAGLIGFYYGVKNLVLDSTGVPHQTITLLDWGVSQNNLLSNVKFSMTPGAAGHVGIAMPQICSSLIMNDLQFYGGGTGVLVTSTQYHFKSLVFDGVQTAVKLARIVQGTGQGLEFRNCKVGVDLTGGGSGMFSLIDSTAINTTTVVLADEISTSINATASGFLVLENLVVDSVAEATLKTANRTILTGSIPPNKTLIRGTVYLPNKTFTRSSGILLNTTRPAVLINPSTHAYHTLTPPTYADVLVSSVLNVKTHPLHPVRGDGITDDTASLQAIISSPSSRNKLLYFPHGIYLLTSTLRIPPSTRLVGEAWTQLSASGSFFADPNNPKPMIQVGKPGDVGTVQFSDFILTVADILPGAVLIKVNMKGPKPGDVGFFNTHFRVGGARGSKVFGNAKCRTKQPAECLAARMMVHLTEGSSSYWENSWGWTADHDLDMMVEGEVGLGEGAGETYPATGAGWLVEAREGTWILGAGPEHNVLYQMNIHNAKNVFMGLQQGETPYWQGPENPLLAPEPWGKYLLGSDPDFAWCAPDDNMCRMGLYQIITNSSDINIYSSGFWNFVAGPNRTMCTSDCQHNAVLYENNSRLFVYGLSTINNKNLVIERVAGEDAATVAASRAENSGSGIDGFSNAIVAAYLRQSG
ncbi:pectate lyase superfamily protein-domain-containing protein [Podospora aff. communis PSN243]|uniref:Pectate lyase superfamily protein-domain-containing protein n=1 Tax=Podospora aff. communis PSN243 TaxID=3040156 RepID=A0AAV9GSE3_9PEZI|nr:pectate lyase superfamily protein-domain-containing protein [Podospora aff. communis PSN243]